MAAEARELAEQLNAENIRRQQEEAEIVAQAKKAVETDLEIGSRTVIVVAGEGWHRGVIGIVASKLVDAFHRPAIVLSMDGDVAHGSCRSIPSFNMLGALESCGELMIEVRRPQAGGRADDRGGAHPRAARRGQRVRGRLPRPGRPAAAAVDRRRARIPVHQRAGRVGAGLAGAIRRRAIQARSSATSRVEIVDGPRRIKDRHLKMAFKQDGRIMRGIAWRASERESFVTEHRAAIDLAFSLEQDTWNGERYLQLSVADFKAPETSG